jgi:Domain of unknown function (DUF4062)
MPDTRKIIRVFLASPGDLQDERRAAKTVVDEFNKLWAAALGYHVELVGWEDTISQYGRPQATINQDLERCEVIVGMVWKRWGTPPSKTGSFASGFEEEFETSLKKRRASGRPELALFFKEIDKELLRDPGEELKKVLAFKERIIAGKEILFETFEGRGEFEGKIRACITGYVQRLRDAETQKMSSEAQATPAETRPLTEEEAKSTSTTTIAVKAAQFLRDFLGAAEAREESGTYTAVDVARFRLLATTVSEQGNDESTIGAHDSNLLFAHRLELDLELREKMALVRSGIENFTSENVPLWYWYAQIDGFENKMLSFYSFYRKAPRLHANALRAMQLIEEPLPVTNELKREFFLRHWFDKDSASDQKSAALAYLSECGLPEDLTAIRREFERGDYQTRSASVDAIIRINLRQGRELAIRALYELQPDSIDKQLLALVFEKDVALDEKLLAEGTNHRSALVRRKTTGILAKRGRLQVSDAERLLSDTDEHIRYLALSSLLKSGRTLSEEEAKAALVRQTAHGLLGGFAGGDRQFKRFKQVMLSTKTDAELEALAANPSIFDRDAKLALLKRHFVREKDELGGLIEDQFKEDFAKSLADFAARFGEENQVVKDTKGLEEFVRKGFTRKALDIVCEASTPEHLGLVRKALASDFVDYSSLDLEYLKKHGEWQDIPLVIAVSGKLESGMSLAGSDYRAKHILAAKAICAIGKERLAELLEKEMPKQLLAQLIIEVSDRSFRSLSNQQLKRLLLDTDDSVRKGCALKAVHTLAKKRLKQILDDYLESEDQRYYNVVHWLDLGNSVPSNVAKRAANKVIAKEWPNDSSIFD